MKKAIRWFFYILIMIVVKKREWIDVNLLDKITAKQINPNVPEFRVGYTVSVGCKII